MLIKALKTCAWKTGKAGVQTQFTIGKIYDVPDHAAKAMIKAEYAEKSSKKDAEKAGLNLEKKVIQPENKEEGSTDPENKNDGSNDENGVGEGDESQEAEENSAESKDEVESGDTDATDENAEGSDEKEEGKGILGRLKAKK